MEIGSRLYFNAFVRNVEKRSLMEAELRESELKFKDMFESISDIFSRTDNDGIIQMVSPSVYEILGYTQEELIGTNIKDIYVNPGEQELLKREVKKNGIFENFEVMVYTKDKQIKFLSINAKIFVDSDGKPIGVESITRDITFKKEAENKLKASSTLLKESQKIAHLGHLLWDIKNDVMEWSDEVYRIYGVDPSIVPDIDYTTSLVHPDDLQFVKENLDLAIRHIKTYDIEHRVIRPDNGKIVWVKAKAKLNFDENGNPISLIETVLDISDKKRDEQALLRREEEFRAIFEVSYSGIPLVDQRGKFMSFNVSNR